MTFWKRQNPWEQYEGGGGQHLRRAGHEQAEHREALKQGNHGFIHLQSL